MGDILVVVSDDLLVVNISSGVISLGDPAKLDFPIRVVGVVCLHKSHPTHLS